MNPYRASINREVIVSGKAPKLRTFRRKLLLSFYGRFKERKPDKCQECGKRSGSIGGSICPYVLNPYVLNNYDCGHRRYPRIWASVS